MSQLATLGIALATLALVATPAAAKGPRLKLSEKSAVPGQVLVAKAKGVSLKKASAKIGGKRAELVSRSKRRALLVVPDLKPGKVKVVVRARGRKLSSKVRVRKGFKGAVERKLDQARAVSGEIGPAGGEITATAADGTRFTLSVPANALAARATLTLTPVASVGGLPGTEGPAVQFGPDGLVFASPARLRITPARPLVKPVGFAYGGDGTGLSLARAQPSGASVVLAVKHFSGAGVVRLTPAQFNQVIARLSLLPTSLPVAAEFYAAFRAIPQGDEEWCYQQPTCSTLKAEVDQLLGTLTVTECEETAGTNPQASQIVSVLNLVLALEGHLAEIGRPPRAVLPRCREELARGLLLLTEDTTKADPLGVSGPCASVAGADYDSDGLVRDLECGLYAGFIASMQGFPQIQDAAIAASTTGLQKLLTDGKAKCDQAFSHAEGLADLRKGSAMAAPFALLTAEVNEALEYCVKITVAPAVATVEVGKTLDFAATARDPTDTSFQWTVDRGTISQAGRLTAPTTPGPLTLTAASQQHPDREGHALVTVACPTGQVESQGQCQMVAITIDPTSASLSPGGTQQFTATVTGTPDTRVTWQTNGGAVTNSGAYTAPQAPGSFTVTAVSVVDPSKSASATVVVGGAVVVIGRDASIALTSQQLVRDPALPFSGSWSEQLDDSGDAGSMSASQTSDVEPRADGTDWLAVDAQATASGSGFRGYSYHQVRFDNPEGATLSCAVDGSFEGEDPPGDTFAGASVYLDDTLVYNAPDGPVNGGLANVVLSAGAHSVTVVASVIADSSSLADISLACDFDRAVEVAPNS